MSRISATNVARSGVPVILTGGGHVSVLAAVRALAAAGHAPWVAVHDRGSYAARSRAAAGIIGVPSPWEDGPGFVRALADAATRVKAPVIIPGTEFGMVTIAQHADIIPPGVIVSSPSLTRILDSTDKGRLDELAREVGLSTPPTVDVGVDDPPGALPFDYPVVVKPHRSEYAAADGLVRHHGARSAASAAELKAALAPLPAGRGLVQPYMPGPLGSVAGVFWGGRLVCAIQSSADRLWPMPCGSISHAITVPLDRSLADRVGELLRASGWEGLFQVDLVAGPSGPMVIDLNPRFYTSLAHATHAGLNLPAIWVDLLIGREPHVPATYRVGVGYRHEVGDLRALAHMLIHGPRLSAFRELLPRRDTAWALYAAGDPGPLLTSLSRLARTRPTNAVTPTYVGGKGDAAA